MKSKKKKVLLIILAVLLAAVLVVVMTLRSSLSGDVKGESPFLHLQTEDMDGNAVDNSDLAENKLNVVNAWNVFCTACVEEMPTLDRLNQEYTDKGVAIWGLYYEQKEEIPAEDLNALAEITAGLSFPQLKLSQSLRETQELENMYAFPTTYFVDAEGNVVEKVVGNNDYDSWVQLIEANLERVENNG